MQKLKLLECDQKDHFLPVTQNLVVRSQVKNEAMRSFYRQMLDKALKEINTILEKLFGDVLKVAKKYFKKKIRSSLSSLFFQFNKEYEGEVD